MTPTETLQAPARWPSLVGWGAIIAGLFFVITSSWLLFLLGSAIGISIADASDMEAIGKGFGISAVVWIVVSGIVAYFLGSMVASRLSGRADDAEGALHGLILWSVATVVLLVLGFWGMGGLVNAGKSVITGTVSAGKTLVQSVGSMGSSENELTRSPVMTDVQAIIKRAAAGAGEQASSTEANQAISELSATSGGQVSPDELRQAMERLDQDVLAQVAQQLILGNTDAAKNVLIANTNLSEQEVDALIKGVAQQVEQRVDQAKQQVAETAEQVARYTQALMWTLFFSALLALVASLAGGLLGARTLHRWHGAFAAGRRRE